MNLDRFLDIVKKYTEIEKLTPTILNEFVEKIIVHAPDKSTGKRVQQVEISYNCVGVIELPDTNETDSKRIAKMTMPLAVTILLYWGPPYPSSFLLCKLNCRCCGHSVISTAAASFSRLALFIADLFQFNLLSVLFSFGCIAFSIILLPAPQPPAHSFRSKVTFTAPGFLPARTAAIT